VRLAFLGSPDFAVPALRALHDAGHSIAAVYCQPPKPAGRGQAVRRCPVHVAADALGLLVRTPRRLRTDDAAQQDFAALDLDAAVVAAYGLILPQAMLDAPRRGCLNIHASLLPRWRGAAPIQAAILAGDAETGITIMQVEAGLDTGPMLLRESVPITPTTTAATLHDALAAIGARLILRALAENPPPVPQSDEGATYAPKLSRDDARIDWTMSAVAIERRVRAFDPWPGTFTLLAGAVLKVLAVAPADAERVGVAPGTVLDDRLTVACGSGALRLTRVQLAGRAAVDADAFLRGHRIPAGVVFGGVVEPVAGEVQRDV
jgi:methionyl-tRNA formyltransferase